MTAPFRPGLRGVWPGIVLAVLVWIFGHRIATQPLHWEEPRRCLVAMEMIERGDWLVPREMGEPYFNKPPFHAWLIALASGLDVRGVGPLSARGVSLLALLAVGGLLWRLGVDGRQDRRSAWPPLIFVTSGLIVQFGRTAEIDLLFVFWITAALAAFEAGRRSDRPWLQWTVSQAALAGGILTKGWAPLFFYPPVFWLLWRGRARLRVWPVLGGVAALLILVGIWYVPYSQLVDATAFRAQLGEQLADRTISLGPLAFAKHLLRYPLIVFVALLPWSLWLAYRSKSRFAELRARVREDPFLELAAAAGLWVVIVYAAVPGIRERYLIPAIAPFAVLVGALIEQVRASEPVRAAVRWRSVGLAAVAAIWIAAIVHGSANAEPAVTPWLPAVVGLLAIVGAAAAPRPRTGTALLLAALLYGVYVAGVHERRHEGRDARFDRVAAALVDALRPEVPIVIGATDERGNPGLRRKLAVALARQAGRVPRVTPPDAPPWDWVAVEGHAPRLAEDHARARHVTEADGIGVWRVSGPESESKLDGRPLWPPPLKPEALARREADLAEARAARNARPDDPEAWVWLGRRTAYLGRYREAIDVFDQALERFPDEPRLLRHRGHRWITLRRPDLAVRDLARATSLVSGQADEIEPDGMPNAFGIPRSTLHGNIAYHLALAHYLAGDLEDARAAWERALTVATNDDSRCAASYWLYLTLLRSGEPDLAARVLEPIGEDLDVIENHDYQKLLLFYRGVLPLSALQAAGDAGEVGPATLGYGLGAWHLAHGRVDEARAALAHVVAGGEWAAFGHIAAEYELARVLTWRRGVIR